MTNHDHSQRGTHKRHTQALPIKALPWRPGADSLPPARPSLSTAMEVDTVVVNENERRKVE